MYYEQNTELQLLLRLLEPLHNKFVIDVGAEQGSFVQAFLDQGCPMLFAFEPYPPNVITLRQKFGSAPTTKIFAQAIGSQDGTVTLHIAEDKTASGNNSSYHSIIASHDTATIHWAGELAVECRSLDSLILEGTLPAEVGIVKIDTEGNDFAVIQGMNKLASAVVMIEYWNELPDTVGTCPYQLPDAIYVMRQRGYSNFVFIKRHDEFEIIQLNSAYNRPGDWGNVIFIHDSFFQQLYPIIDEQTALTQSVLIDKAFDLRIQCQRRLEIIEQQSQSIDQYMQRIEQQNRTVDLLNQTVERQQQDLAQQNHSIDLLNQTIVEQNHVLWLQNQPIEKSKGSLHLLRLLPAKLGYTLRRRFVATKMWLLPPPKLGVLFQHPPVPLQIPPRYTATITQVAPLTISVVTPSYNQGRFLEATIKSLLTQNYPSLEYIIQDSASTDETSHILQQYHSQLRYESVKDDGQANAINLGFAKTSGEIMAYLNSDDLLLAGSLHYVAKFFATHPDVDVVYGQRIVIDEYGQEIGRWVLPPHDDAVLSWADYIPQETLFWRRQLWERVGSRVDESFRFAADWDLILRFREAGAHFARLPRFLGAFRVHAQQKTSTQISDIGEQEMFRLRERSLQRSVTYAEISRHLIPYYRRHRITDKLYNMGILHF